MARTPGSYNPIVPLGVTWDEQLQLFQDDGVTPVDISGYSVIAQFGVEKNPLIDPITKKRITDPVFELTTANWYTVDPAWPVIESWTVPTPANGTIISHVGLVDLWNASPNNAKRKLYMSILLVNPSTLVSIDVVEGAAIFLPAKTVVIVQ